MFGLFKKKQPKKSFEESDPYLRKMYDVLDSDKHPDDNIKTPRLPDGSYDYEAIKRHPRTTRKEKIQFCAMSNNVLPMYNIALFSRLSDEKLDMHVEIFEDLLECDKLETED